MSNNQLPADVQRIKNDAERYAGLMVWVNTSNDPDKEPLFHEHISSTSYIAGATAETENIQPVIDALDQFISFHESGLLPAKHVYEKAIAARKQWKEGKDEPVKEQLIPTAVYKQVGSKTDTTKEIAMQFTKGRWYLQKYTDAYTNIIRCDNGKGHETLFIAATPQSWLPEARANAKLMAAAPDLLEALQEIIAITDRKHVAWVKAKAAIEKAIGNEF